MSEETNKYLSAYTGAQIDKAYRTVSNIQPSGSGKIVSINSSGLLVPSTVNAEDIGSKPQNWEIATQGNFIIYEGVGFTTVSNVNADSFMSAMTSGTSGNIPTLAREISTNKIILQDSGISAESLSQALVNISSLQGNEIVSGTLDTSDSHYLVVLEKEDASTISIDIEPVRSGLQPLLTSLNKLNADYIADGSTNVVLTRGEQTITGNKTYTGTASYIFGDDDSITFSKELYNFNHTNGDGQSSLSIRPNILDINYEDPNNNENYVEAKIDGFNNNFVLHGERGNYNATFDFKANQFTHKIENSVSDAYSQVSQGTTMHRIFVNNPTLEGNSYLSINTNSGGIYTVCDNFQASPRIGHHVGSEVVANLYNAYLYGYDTTNHEYARITADYNSYNLEAKNSDLDTVSHITGKQNEISMYIADGDGVLKILEINEDGAYIDGKEIAVKEDITTEVDSAISDLVDVLQTSLTSDLIIAAQVKAKADAAYRSSASGIKLVEDANKFNIYHEPVTVSGALKSKGYELKSDASYVTLKNTTDNTSISLGSDIKLGDSQHGLQFFSNTGQFVLGTSNLTAIFGSGRLSVDDSNINYQIASKSKIYADSSNVILNNNLTDHSKLSLTNNASILSYTNVNNIANQIKVDNEGVEISLGGTAVQKANFVRSSNGTEIILDNQYKVLTDRDFGYLDLTGNIDVYDPTSGVITNGVFYDDGGTLREAYYADPNGILSPEQLIEVRKQSCIIYVSGRYFIKCTDGNFYSFRTPYNYNNQVTREGVIYNYTSQKWKVDVLTITGNTYTISITELDMMDFTQTKKLVDETVAVLNQALTGALQRIQTLENTVSSFESRITALENASTNYARIRQH